MARAVRWVDLLWQMWNSPGARAKLVSLVLLVVAMVWGYRRLLTAQERDRRRREAEQGAGGAAGAGGRAGGPAGGARPAGFGFGGGAGAAGGAFGDDAKSSGSNASARRGPPPNTNTPAGRVAKYLERSSSGRMTVCISARVLLSGLTAVNSDGLAAPIEFVDASAAAGASNSGSDGGAVVALLRRLAAASTVYVITKVPTNPSALEERVLRAFDRAGGGGLLGATLIKPHNLLFCSSAAGKGAMIRHITPNLVVDDELEVLEKLRPHIDDVVHVPSVDTAAAAAATASGSNTSTGTGGNRAAGTIGECSSLAQYFFGNSPAPTAAPVATAADERDVKKSNA